MTGRCVCCTNWFNTRPRTQLTRNHNDHQGNLCPGSGHPPQEENL